jgi:tricorn protease
MSTVDGSQVQEPNSGFFGRDGKWWIENHGADPDIDLDNDPGSVMAGRDLQLEKAIEVIKAEIEQAKKDKSEAIPPRPNYPKR